MGAMANLAGLKTIVGFLLAPISPGVLVAIAVAPFRFPTLGHWELDEAIFLIKLSAMLGYPVAFVIGLPLYGLFRWRGWTSFWLYLAVGALLGAATYFVLFPHGTLQIDSTKMSVGTPWLVTGVVCGMIATSCFGWLQGPIGSASVLDRRLTNNPVRPDCERCGWGRRAVAYGL
jgi:hypothetical protein